MTSKQVVLFMATLMLFPTVSCHTTATTLFLEPHAKPIRICTLTTVQLESIFSYSSNQRELRSLIIAIGTDHGFTILDQNERSPFYTIRFILREKNYLSGLKTIHSSAIIAEICNPAGEVLYQSTWINDSKKTLDSMTYLCKALHCVFRALGHTAFHPKPL